MDRPEKSFNLEIVADDLGYCPERTKGILKLLKENKIQKTSLMVNVPHFSKPEFEENYKKLKCNFYESVLILFGTFSTF